MNINDDIKVQPFADLEYGAVFKAFNNSDYASLGLKVKLPGPEKGLYDDAILVLDGTKGLEFLPRAQINAQRVAEIRNLTFKVDYNDLSEVPQTPQEQANRAVLIAEKIFLAVKDRQGQSVTAWFVDVDAGTAHRSVSVGLGAGTNILTDALSSPSWEIIEKDRRTGAYGKTRLKFSPRPAVTVTPLRA
jgi:hypothetical protein